MGRHDLGPIAFSSAEGRAAFEQFTARLLALARSRLDVRLQHKVDPEEVVQSAFKSLLRRYGEDELAKQGIDAMWSLLTVITLRKCADRARYLQAECRNVNREAAAPADDAPEPWREAVSREPTGEHVAVLAETLDRMMSSLSETELPVFELCLQGCSTQEVSRRLGRPERSVRRLRERLRKQLERLQIS